MTLPSHLLRTVLVSLAIAFLLTLLYLAGAFEEAENLSYDAVIRLEGEQARAEALIMVVIDESSLTQLGRWPWPRDLTAELLKKISEGGPAAIGVDIGFFEPDLHNPEHDEKLVAVTEESGRVILPVYLADQPSLGEIVAVRKPFPALYAAAAAIGHVHTEPSPDGVVRKVYLLQECGDESVPAFAVRCLDQYLASTGKENAVRYGENEVRIGNILIPTLSRQAGDREKVAGLIGQDHLLYIRFAGPAGSFLRLPAWEVLTPDFPRQIFREKIVLVGSTAAGLGDFSMTPLSAERNPMPGVEIQANIINTILTGNFITRPPMLLAVALIFAFSLISGWFFYTLSTRGAFVVFLLLLLATAGFYLLFLLRFRLWMEVWPLLAAVLLNYLTVTARKLGFLFRSLDGEIAALDRIQKIAPPLPGSPGGEPFFAAFSPFLSSLLGIDTAFLLAHAPGDKNLTVLESWGVKAPDGAGESFLPPPVFREMDEPREVACPQVPRSLFGEGDINGTCLVIPLDGDGKRLGYLVSVRASGSHFTPEEISAGRTVAYHLGHALRKREEYTRAREAGGSVIHFFHPGGMERKILSLGLLSRAITYEQILLSSMLGSIADGVIVSDLLGNILLVNPRARRILDAGGERTGDFIITDLLRRFLALSPGQFAPLLLSIITGGETVTREITVAGRIYLLSLTAIRRKEGIPGGIMAVFTDITYLKELDSLRAETMAMLSHEIKNPLSGIMSFCDLFLGGDLKPEEISHYIHLIRTAVSGLNTLVGDYLTVTRLESGVQVPGLTSLNLAGVAHESIDLLAPRAREKGIEIESDLPLALPEIPGDETMLRQVCNNLIGNAIQYSPSGTRITVTVSPGPDRVVLRVADRGYGIPEEDREKIFEKFYRGGRTRKITGTGLGLTITKKIVERHGGEISVDERPGGGSVFSVVFPVGNGDQ